MSAPASARPSPRRPRPSPLAPVHSLPKKNARLKTVNKVAAWHNPADTTYQSTKAKHARLVQVLVPAALLCRRSSNASTLAGALALGLCRRRRFCRRRRLGCRIDLRRRRCLCPRAAAAPPSTRRRAPRTPGVGRWRRRDGIDALTSRAAARATAAASGASVWTGHEQELLTCGHSRADQTCGRRL